MTVASPVAGVTVGEVMRPGVVTCEPEDTVGTLAGIMVNHGIHAVVVGSRGEGVPLIISDLEFVEAALDRPEATVNEIAHEPIATLPAEAPLDQAVAMMAERYVSHLLATERGSDAPAGIVSSFDIAAVLGFGEPSYAHLLRVSPARPSLSTHSLTEARAGEVMHPGIATCPADASLTDVARSMAEHRVHCIAVVGVERRGQHLTWGLISDMDLVLALHRGALAEPASSIAATEPVAVQENESLDRLVALMVEHQTTHVVVVGASGLPSGIVSTLDVAGVVAADA